MMYNAFRLISCMTFGSELKKKRTEKRFSLRELARRTNDVCTYSYIAQLEGERGGKKGTYSPDVEIVEALAKALDWDINEARLAAGYAPVNVQMQNGFKIHLPDGLEMYIPYSVEISTQEEADRLQQDIELVYQMTKERLRRDRCNRGVSVIRLSLTIPQDSLSDHRKMERQNNTI